MSAEFPRHPSLYGALPQTLPQKRFESFVRKEWLANFSIFRESYPREMFEAMKKSGLEVKERYPGIYYISGKHAPFDTQIVATKQLDKETHTFFNCAVYTL